MTQPPTTASKRDSFFQLHAAGCFVMPNPWSIGTARCLEDLGFQAIASTSSGHAHANGLPDGAQSLESVLAHLKELAAAVNIPLNADFENGFSEDLEGMQENIVRCVATGVAGLSIEDTAQEGASGLYDFERAVTRIKAARAAIDHTGHRVLLTARTEGFVRGAPDINETVRRIKAYADAGADCLYAPGITTKEDINAVLQAAGGVAVNFLNAVPLGYTVDDLARLGVRRISVGGSLSRVAMDAFLHAAQDIAQEGSFEGFAHITTNADLNQRFQRHVDGAT
ncbi:isocitrate lyase/PEP mutase family protein [Pollutimonas harenae]|uniref:Isocitrate lyase/phosphoenolpyruvate mutase family protein n=1 Tax=Pollutimonas harenae TaxID=657015 RepID=A0A853GTA3_9BURK|nr:isocitrate lyase/phosphoenolpyruvate mutase family protein [Pollutimonas harenae]NYT85397.1 isocitrate lyase/phosphoenolpyruvate mutase family protein [Pollutimonas harenae]TEA70494.1 isocitrate lyase/phosphoenolpyruvate mutase family protein [Pollutimonas harenae]